MARGQDSLLSLWFDGASSSQPWYAAYSLYGRASATTDRSLDYGALAAFAAALSRYRYVPAAGQGAPHPDGPDRTGLSERARDLPADLDGK